MEGFLSLLVFAGLFFLMMRFGCGAPIVHGRHNEQGGDGPAHGGNGPTVARSGDTDPVCGMPVPADGGYAKMYQGTLYRFCSRNCLDKFDADPRQYLSRGKKQS